MIKLPLKKKTKRKAGTRAGLTKAAIAAAAAKQVEAPEAGGLSLRELAKAMGVAPTTIHAHFKGGVSEVIAALAASALTDVTRPYKPKEEAANYLRDMFLRILKALHGRPTVAKFVVLQLSYDPMLVPLLTERLLLSLTELGVPNASLPQMFHRSLGAIFEMILTESARSKPAAQKQASIQMNKAIAALSPTEFPNLTMLREALVAETATGTAPSPTADVAARYVNRLISGLSAS